MQAQGYALRISTIGSAPAGSFALNSSTRHVQPADPRGFLNRVSPRLYEGGAIFYVALQLE